ncbi:serine carboxypeptidase-like 45 [Lathyrus oleraceus]|nr:serine carboxypeptidase-like 45 [Pisum sativum]
MSALSIFFSILFCFLFSYGAATHKIISLPDQPPVNFSQYSGYITVDVNHQRNLFYYFVESEVNPSSKPVILWLHGGPGCSAVGEAAFTQHGPFLVTPKGLVKNPFSWNKEANVIYLDSPAGVGFSYSANTSDYIFLNDEFAARDHLVFLEHWFGEFSKFRTNDFFIAGESYAGHFAPQLANLILQTKSKINLKGIAIGNPLLEFDTDFNAMGEFLKLHGLISNSTYEMLNNVCSYATMRRQLRATGKLSTSCFQINIQMEKEIDGYIDIFNILADLCPVPPEKQAYLLAKERAGVKTNACIRDDSFAYLNRKDVQSALHAKLVGVKVWSTCSGVLVYDFQNLENPTIYLLGTLVKAGVRVLAYSGDQDAVIPFIATESLIYGLARDLGLNITRHHEAWFQGGQVAGWTQVYGNILTFATVRGAGHSTPLSQPERSLEMLKAFLKGKPLPKRPPFPIKKGLTSHSRI